MRKRTAQTLSFLVIVILFVIGTIAFRSCYSKKPSENVGLSKNLETEPVNTSILPSSASLEDTDYKLYVLNKINDDSYICNDRIFKMDGEGNLYKKNTDDSFDIICKYRDLEIEGWSPFIYRKLENIPDYIPRKIDEIIKNYGIKNNFCYEPGNESRYICSDGIYDYYELNIINGGGSGEFWGEANSGVYIGVHNDTGEIKEFGNFRAGYCKEKDGWVYYLDLINSDQERSEGITLSNINGMGYPSRMKPDGSEKQKLSNAIAVGDFNLHDNKIYFISINDNKLTVISEDGKERFYENHEIFFEESYRYHLLRLSFFDKYILHEDYSENCICILTDLSDYQWLNPPEKYNHLSVLTWDEHSILISAFETVENPNNNALYLYSNLNLN